MIKTYFLFLIWSITWQSHHCSLDRLFNHTPTTRWRKKGRWRPTLIKKHWLIRVMLYRQTAAGPGIRCELWWSAVPLLPPHPGPPEPLLLRGGRTRQDWEQNTQNATTVLGSKKIITKLTEKVQIRGLSFLVLTCGSFSFRFFLRDLRHA